MVEGPGATRNARKLQAALGYTVVVADFGPSALLDREGGSGKGSSGGLVGRTLLEAFSVGKEVFLIFSPLSNPVSDGAIDSSVVGNDAKPWRQRSCTEIAESDPVKLRTNEDDVAVRLHFGMTGSLWVAKEGSHQSQPYWRKKEECSLRIKLSSTAPSAAKSWGNYIISQKAEVMAIVDASSDTATGQGRKITDFFPSSCRVPSRDKAPSFSNQNSGSTKKCKRNDITAVATTPVETMVVEAKGTSVSKGFVSASMARSKRDRLRRLDVCGGHEFDTHAVFAAIRKCPASIVSDAVLNQDRFPGVGNIIKIEGLHLAQVHPKRTVASLSDEELLECIRQCRRHAMSWLSSGRAPAKSVYDRTDCGTCGSRCVQMQKLGNELSRVTFWCEACQPIQTGDFGERNTDAGTDKPHESGYKDARVCGQDMGERRNSKRSTHPEDIPICSEKRSCPAPPTTTTVTGTFSCPQHGPRSVVLRRVRKEDSINKQRLFCACSSKGCQFFAWADSHFPNCTCRRKVILKVSKTQASGGRWFLCCARGGNGKGRSTACGFFSWANQSLLAPFGHNLTPLL